MKLCRVSDIVGGERLARPIMTNNYQELLAAGTILKPEYVQKIKQLGIEEVFIDDAKLRPEQVVILREDVEDLFKEKVRSVMERHVYNDNAELVELTKTADSIINKILEDDQVVERIYDIMERSADIYEHSISVCSISVLVAIKMKLSNKEIHNLAVASIFHDIGLRYLDFNYANINIAELPENNRESYVKHPVYAYSALEKESFLSEEAKHMILEHHERIDGSGYPRKVSSSEKGTLILQACEAFDEMICGMGCRRTRVYEAVEFLKVTKAIKFDEEVVNTLLEFTAVYPAGTVCILNSGEMGIVIRQNKNFPERPVLRIIKDKNGINLEEEVIWDLIEVNNVFIEKVII